MIVALLDEMLRFAWVSRVIPQLNLADVVGHHPWEWAEPSDADNIKSCLSRCLLMGETQRYRSVSEVDGVRIVWSIRAERVDNPRSIICISQQVPAWAQEMTETDIDILRLLVAGHNQQQVAELLSLNQSTVSRHVERICARVGMTLRAVLLQVATL